MRRASTLVLHAVAGLAGAAAGWVLMAHPMAAMFAPTRVTWDATSCPAGVYSITSTARNVATGGVTFLAGPTVSLPQSSVAVEFPNLPAGTYAVTASGRRGDGQSFGSAAQTVRVLDPSGSAGGSGRSRPPSIEATGRAAARPTAGATAPATSTGQPAAAPPRITRGLATVRLTAQPPISTAKSTQESRPHHLDRTHLLFILDADWRLLEIADIDGDGLIDVVWIQMTDGEVWVFHVK